MSAYGHQMEQMYSAQSLSGGSELRRSSFALESGFYITSFAATIFVAALAALGLLLITLLISLAMMLQSCQSSHAGVIEVQNIHDEYSYCKVYSLHAKLNNLEGHNFPNHCKDLAIQYIKGGQYARDLDSTKSVIEDYFNSVRPSDDGLDVVLLDIDGIFSPNPHSSNLFQSNNNCVLEAKKLKRMLLLRIYTNLQAGGWSIILLSREHGTHQNVTINRLVSAGFRNWSSLVMSLEDEDSTKGNENFSRQRNVIQTKGYRLKSMISSQMDALAVVDREIRFFWLPDPIFDVFEQAKENIGAGY
ncbi:uncharacterized protein At2g39920 isoform X2 [Cajanus cajan]|uniref:uncharacterized protein At2g39920 isoform X2 n=1 Tax=Cajanus cajan TaxID=3821 RepID=UPI00098DA88E|nr:uncharacterized protein At2g39920 isoform X2 [Cajanus cajan]